MIIIRNTNWNHFTRCRRSRKGFWWSFHQFDWTWCYRWGESNQFYFCWLLQGLNIFYPNQVAKNPPTPYPWTIAGSGDNLTIKNLLLVNSYQVILRNQLTIQNVPIKFQGIDFATKPCGRHYIEGVYGQPLLTGIAVDQCYDIGR